MLPFPLFFLAALAASALAQDDPQEKGGSAPYKICPTKEYSKPYCCTHLIWGMGIGCRARKFLRTDSRSRYRLTPHPAR